MSWVAALAGATITFGAVAIGLITVGWSVVAGSGMDWLDSEYKFTDRLSRSIHESIDYLESLFPKDFSGYKEALDPFLPSFVR